MNFRDMNFTDEENALAVVLDALMSPPREHDAVSFAIVTIMFKTSKDTVNECVTFWEEKKMFVHDSWWLSFFAAFRAGRSPGARWTYCTGWNHPSGYGCSREGCEEFRMHRCYLCNGADHGAFFYDRTSGKWKCPFRQALEDQLQRLHITWVDFFKAAKRIWSDFLALPHLERARLLAKDNAEGRKKFFGRLSPAAAPRSALSESMTQMEDGDDSSEDDREPSFGPGTWNGTDDDEDDDDLPVLAQPTVVYDVSSMRLTLQLSQENLLGTPGIESSVYRATLEIAGIIRPVAVKVWKLGTDTQTPAAKEMKKHWKQEVESLVALAHKCDHIVPFIPFPMRTQAYNNSYYMFVLMEIAAGGSLGSYLSSRQGQTSLSLRREFSRQLLEAYSFCHASERFHRDVKPDNVLVYERHDGAPLLRLCDFALSRQRDTGRGATKWATAVVGTTCPLLPCFTAPEVLRVFSGESESYGSASESWSVGALLHWIFSEGAVLFPGRTSVAAFNSQADLDHYLLNDVFCAQHPLICSLLMRLLKLNPAQRASPSELLRHPALLSRRAFGMELLRMVDDAQNGSQAHIRLFDQLGDLLRGQQFQWKDRIRNKELQDLLDKADPKVAPYGNSVRDFFRFLRNVCAHYGKVFGFQSQADSFVFEDFLTQMFALFPDVFRLFPSVLDDLGLTMTGTSG